MMYQMKQKAPVNVRALTGATICTAEAAQVRASIIRLQAVEFKRRFHDLSFLQNRRR